jgi:hypothetical protein
LGERIADRGENLNPLVVRHPTTGELFLLQGDFVEPKDAVGVVEGGRVWRPF